MSLLYRVMVVDDEPIVRLAVRSLVNWEAYGFRFDLEASNGKQALKILDENSGIDIVITDINMPVMDGLEFIAEAAAKGLGIEIIVLSAYNEYAWVRRAFKLGVNDYILKTEMEPEGILTMLNGMAQKIRDKRDEAPAGNSGNAGRSTVYQREVILKALLEQEDDEYIAGELTGAGMRVGRKNASVCYLWVDDYQTVIARYNDNALKPFVQSVYNSIYQVLSQMNMGEALCLSPQEYVVFLSFDDASRKQIRDKIIDIMGRIKHHLVNYVNIDVSIGVSGVRSGFENFRELFEQAKNNARLRFVLGKGKIIFPEDAEKIKIREIESIIGKEAGFVSALKEADAENTLSELNMILEAVKCDDCLKIEKIYSNYMELIFIIISFLSDTGKDVDEVFGKEIDFYEKMLRFETQEEINVWVRNIVMWVVSFLQESKGVKVSRLISGAREFIRNNYCNEDITLKLVSDYVQLSESHFSSTFAKEMGETFTDYLTRIRIEKAKELITDTSLKIYEICERVGYTNTEHFSRIFKKVVGCSPKEYKKS